MTKGKKILAHAVLILASFLSVFPLYYMLCGATNTSIDVVRGKLIPGTYLVENFKSLVANQNLGLAMANSFRNAILMTLITLLVCSIAGYGTLTSGVTDSHGVTGGVYKTRERIHRDILIRDY